jgi:tetratricopeptide (TPR) repeat protein
MRRVVFLLVGLGIAVAAFFGIRAAHEGYGSWWLTLYLTVAGAMPLFFTTVRIALGVQGIKDFFRALFSAMLGLMVVTLVYQHVTEKWLWACLTGLLAVGIVAMVRQWAVLTAQTRITQADQLLRDGKPQAALKIAQEVRSAFVGKGNREGQALAEWVMGVAYARLNENIRAARYLNSALALYKALDKEEQVKRVENELSALRARGVDVRASAVTADVGDEVGRIDWSFLVDGVLSIAFLLALLRLWEVSVFHASLGVMAALGAVLLLFVYGNYAITVLAAAAEERRVRTPLIVFNLALVLLAVSIVGLLLSRGVVQDADFPEALQRAVARFGSLVTGWPGWVTPAVGIVSLIVMLAAIVLASGRSLAGLRKAISRGDVSREALQLAIGHLDSEEWREAITQLTRIDLLEVKDPVRHKEVLYCLAYAHHRAEHPAEARQYITELLGEDPRHQEGLYLAGYMALKDGQLEEAERAWRALNQLVPRFCPPGGSPQQSAAHYLSLALYRQAMQAIDKDLEAGAKLLAEVSEIRALDREVADALIRVHLYRTASLIRQLELDRAAYELGLAKDKLQHLKELVGDKDEVAKLTGLCQATLGLVAFKREQYGEAQTSFGQAIKDTKDLVPKQELFAGIGQSFLEQLLRLAFQEGDKDAAGKINRTFSRDLHFLTSVAVLHSLKDTLSESPKDRVPRQLLSETLTSEVQRNLERSLDIHPDFVEARALLGLLYYYLGPDKAKREKGIEILQTVHKRVGSRFVSKTVAEYEEQQKRKAEARGAYFDLLQQYLRSASVPIKEREELRQRMLDEMKATGEYEDFVGHGGLEIDTEREREPTVREYAARAALLAEKLEELKRLDRAGQLPPEVEELMGQLKDRNEALKEQMERIAEVERKLLLKAQQLL